MIKRNSLLDRAIRGVPRLAKYYTFEDPVSATRRAGHDIRIELLRLIFKRYVAEYGVPIYERDWDVLIILDACRADLMDEVSDEYEFLEPYRTHNSLGNNSGTWLARNFTSNYREEMAETAMVTGNPHSGSHLNSEDFAVLDEVWRYAWEDDSELFRPNYILDRAVSIHRELQPKRMIVHFMQPHRPFIPYFDGFENEFYRTWLNPWTDISAGKASADIEWERYRDNLLYVLDYVETLLVSIDADTVVISSDHGEAIGEWGIYGHPDLPLRVLRQVPWIETEAMDTGEYTPKFEPDTNPTGVSDGEAKRDVHEQLERLGYL